MTTLSATSPAALGAAMQEGLAHHRAGRLSEAEAIYRRVLAATPDHPGALHLLGVIAHETGHNGAAIELIEKAIAGAPEAADFHNNLASALDAHGQPDGAVAAYRKATELNPEFAQAHNNLGMLLRKLGRGADAITALRRATDVEPDFAQAHNNLGVALNESGATAEAVDAHHRAIELQPGYAEAHNNLGVALVADGRREQATDAFTRAIELRPDYVNALSNFGNLLNLLDRHDEAISVLGRALEIDPDHADALNNLGLTRKTQGRYDEAIVEYRKAIARWPEFPSAHLNLALALLSTANFEEGFREYEWRWRAGVQPARSFTQEPWDGREIPSQTLLVYAEQGLGDAIQFVRYLPRLRALSRNVIVECPKPLVRLLQSADGIDQIAPRDEPLPDFDAHAPMLSLPRILQTTLDTVPADVPYLSADPDLVAAWREHLAQRPGFRVGIAWQGHPDYTFDEDRSIPLTCFGPLFEVPGVRMICLQKYHGRDQLDSLPDNMPIEDLAPELDNGPDAFVDTAAVMMELDLIVSADTAIAHLAGALGRPVWLALNFVADWRWMRTRDDTPWYPTMRLFRQPAANDWASVFTAMAGDIRKQMDGN